MMLANSVAVYLLVLSRIIGVLLIIPIFADTIMPRSTRVLFAGVIAFLITPFLYHVTVSYDNLIYFLVMTVKEFLIGVMLSYVLSFPFWMLENVGNIIDVQRGEQMGSLYNPSTKLQSSSIGMLISKGFLVYLVANKGLLLFLQIMCDSFSVMPINDLHSIFNIKFAKIASFFVNYIYWTVVLSLPVIFVLFLVDLSLSVMSAFVPQLNVTITAMPIKAVVAIVMVILFIGVFYHVAIRQFPVSI